MGAELVKGAVVAEPGVVIELALDRPKNWFDPLVVVMLLLGILAHSRRGDTRGGAHAVSKGYATFGLTLLPHDQSHLETVRLQRLEDLALRRVVFKVTKAAYSKSEGAFEVPLGTANFGSSSD